MKDAVSGVMEGKTSPQKAEESPELKTALDMWGYTDPKETRDVLDTVESNKDMFRKLLFSMGYEAFEVMEGLGK